MIFHSVYSYFFRFYPSFSQKKKIYNQIGSSFKEILEIYESASPINTNNNQIIFEEDSKETNFDNMFYFQMRKFNQDDDKMEDSNHDVNRSLKILKKRFTFTMQENFQNLENYFQTYDKILDNKIYSKLIPLVKIINLIFSRVFFKMMIFNEF